MIPNKFLFFKTYDGFEAKKDLGEIPYSSIVFIKDRRIIYTHGTEFGSTAAEKRFKGFFQSLDSLKRLVKNAELGDWAVVNSTIAVCEKYGNWVLTGQTYSDESDTNPDMSQYVTWDLLNQLGYITALNIPLQDGIKHVFLTQQEYNALESYEDNAVYFIIERNDEGWHFGDTFPITFTGEEWLFGGTFPITFKQSWTFGLSFPITLK